MKGPSLRRRQHGYVSLLLTCLGVMACLMLPHGLRQLAAVGYLALPLVLLRTLGLRIDEGSWPTLRMHVYRFLALVTWVTSLVWYLTPLSHRSTGVPLLLLWALLVLWSCERLVRMLALERRINREVLFGALAGYLLLGLAAGLLFSALETVVPGSFAASRVIDAPVLRWHGAHANPASPVWAVDFVELNYFAFVTLTTTGYGDIHPVTPQTQMLCVMVAITGTLYLAMVMGVLISRYTARDVEDELEN
ncbi:potassium channel family protein [Synechococcus sp. HK05]|uniref:potassium channel family protein n=1 Tax=Synechococcus sp. HK05 TaxID=2725975 RepID=UPI0034CFB65E